MTNEELLKITLELQAETLEVIKEVILLLKEVREKLNNPTIIVQPTSQPITSPTWPNQPGYYPPYTVTCGGTSVSGNIGNEVSGKLENINFGLSVSSSLASQAHSNYLTS
jgi:hypothetical protein